MTIKQLTRLLLLTLTALSLLAQEAQPVANPKDALAFSILEFLGLSK